MSNLSADFTGFPDFLVSSAQSVPSADQEAGSLEPQQKRRLLDFSPSFVLDLGDIIC